VLLTRRKALKASGTAAPAGNVARSEDHVIHPELQRLLSKRATRTITWAGDHAAFLTGRDRPVVRGRYHVGQRPGADRNGECEVASSTTVVGRAD
jgi:hypothetical protein